MISELDPFDHRIDSDRFIDNEVRKFENKFPGAKIIRHDYTRESELDDDWNGYLSCPYSLKVLANERCMRLYGCKNEQQYYRQKRKFLSKDIDNTDITRVYRPMDEASEDIDMKNKMAEDYMRNGGHTILKTGYTSLRDLNNDYQEFLTQCIDHQRIANNQSLAIYGRKAQEIYRDEVQKFLRKDINDTEVGGRMYHPGDSDSLVVSNEGSYNILYHITSNSDDLVEKLVFCEADRIESENSNIYTDKVMHEMIVDKVREAIYPSYYKPLGEAYQYLTPWEVQKICEEKKIEGVTDSPEFANLMARGIGIKPAMNLMSTALKDLADKFKDVATSLKHGWLPGIPFDKDNISSGSIRVNRIVKRCIIHQFLDISHSDIEYDKDFEMPPGLAIVIIKELDMDSRDDTKDIPKVLLSTDYESENWTAVTFGAASHKTSLRNTIEKYTYPSVSAYYVPVKKDVVIDFSNLDRFTDIFHKVGLSCPEIADKNLYITTILNAIFSPVESKDNPISCSCISLKVFKTYDRASKNISVSKLFRSFNKISIFQENRELLESAALDRKDTTSYRESTLVPGLMIPESEGIYKMKDFKSLFQ